MRNEQLQLEKREKAAGTRPAARHTESEESVVEGNGGFGCCCCVLEERVWMLGFAMCKAEGVVDVWVGVDCGVELDGFGGEGDAGVWRDCGGTRCDLDAVWVYDLRRRVR